MITTCPACEVEWDSSQGLLCPFCGLDIYLYHLTKQNQDGKVKGTDKTNERELGG